MTYLKRPFLKAMVRKMIKLLVTDLDDTLYPWLGFFVPAFYGMVDELSRILKIDENVIIAEYKTVHQDKGSVEYPYATLLLPCVKKAYPDLSREQVLYKLDPAFHRFNSIRKRELALFPGVKETLKSIFNSGVVIVGFTESAEENGYFRLKKLGVDMFFRKVYVSDSEYKPLNKTHTSHKTATIHGKKPNVDVLLQIMTDEKVLPSETVYVGDSLTKDIYMANQAGVHSVLCKYPSAPNAAELYEKLVAITSWKEEDFIYEAKLKQECQIKGILSDYTIDNFQQIIQVINNINGESCYVDE